MTDALAEIAQHRQPDPSSVDPFVVGPIHLGGGGPGKRLSGLRFAVKDLYDVAGTKTGAGNPERLIDCQIASHHASCITSLIDAGAELVGKTVTDELAFSLSGTNIHYGTPRNPAAPGRVPGGSSSGSASAVADGLVDFALGTDTGGSTRVPASYCGVFGLRATHGRISQRGTFLLAPSFCSIGLFTREPEMLAKVWPVLAADPPSRPIEFARKPARLIIVPELFELADPGAAVALLKAAEFTAEKTRLHLEFSRVGELGDPRELFNAFRKIQLFEAWQLHGPWVSAHHGALGWGIASRFDAASKVADVEVAHARQLRARFQHDLNRLLGPDGYLLQPAASGPAPAIDLDLETKDDLRLRTMMLTAPAGLAGSPALSVPVAKVGDLPTGLSIIGLPGEDEMVINLALRLPRVAIQ